MGASAGDAALKGGLVVAPGADAEPGVAPELEPVGPMAASPEGDIPAGGEAEGEPAAVVSGAAAEPGVVPERDVGPGLVAEPAGLSAIDAAGPYGVSMPGATPGALEGASYGAGTSMPGLKVPLISCPARPVLGDLVVESPEGPGALPRDAPPEGYPPEALGLVAGPIAGPLVPKGPIAGTGPMGGMGPRADELPASGFRVAGL